MHIMKSPCIRSLRAYFMGLAPATVALFYINNLGPTCGGTAHTISLCDRQQVPVFTQRDWLT